MVYRIFINLFSFVLLLPTVPSCRQPLYLTEQYLKTKVEDHKEGQFSRLETYAILQNFLPNQSGSKKGLAYMEFVGYKSGGKTGMVIGAGKFQSRQKIRKPKNLGNITYINLDINQCKAILSNYKELEQKITAEKPKLNQAVYHDYTVSNDLFISFRAAALREPKKLFIDFWIKGEKYTIKTTLFIRKFQQFMKYYAAE